MTGFSRTKVIHEGAGPVNPKLTALGQFPAKAGGLAEKLQSSIRSRLADQSAVRCSGTQSIRAVVLLRSRRP
jgi:hypothetical protein